jgi:hypothetical protein
LRAVVRSLGRGGAEVDQVPGLVQAVPRNRGRELFAQYLLS